jgi:hypothetical protein
VLSRFDEDNIEIGRIVHFVQVLARSLAASRNLGKTFDFPAYSGVLGPWITPELVAAAVFLL